MIPPLLPFRLCVYSEHPFCVVVSVDSSKSSLRLLLLLLVVVLPLHSFVSTVHVARKAKKKSSVTRSKRYGIARSSSCIVSQSRKNRLDLRIPPPHPSVSTSHIPSSYFVCRRAVRRPKRQISLYIRTGQCSAEKDSRIHLNQLPHYYLEHSSSSLSEVSRSFVLPLQASKEYRPLSLDSLRAC